MAQQATAPALFDVQDAFKGAYAPRIQAFIEAGQQAGLTASENDSEKIAVILVDYQHDFVDPDTHLPFQIFYSSWWENPQTGERPQPFTPITLDDVTSKRWVPALQPDWSVQYVHQLQEQAKKELMIWPYHTMEGTLGHMLVAPISEAIAWHSAARHTQPTYIVNSLAQCGQAYPTNLHRQGTNRSYRVLWHFWCGSA